jgi:hypothetical protein
MTELKFGGPEFVPMLASVSAWMLISFRHCESLVMCQSCQNDNNRCEANKKSKRPGERRSGIRFALRKGVTIVSIHLGGGDRGDHETKRNGCDLLQQSTTNVESARCQQPVNTHFRDQFIKALSGLAYFGLRTMYAASKSCLKLPDEQEKGSSLIASANYVT